MGAPSAEKSVDYRGRKGSATYSATWTQTDSDDLANDVILDIVNGTSLDYENPRFAVTTVEWAADETVSGTLEFDSLPWSADNVILQIPPDGGSGEINFCHYPDGCKSDPNRGSPGNVVFSSRNALPGNELWLTMTFKEKGKVSLQ